MEHEVAWKKYDEVDLEALEGLASNYIDFISENKTERRCAATAIHMAEKAGYVSLADAVREGRALSAGDKVWAHSHGKALILVQLGSNPLSEGMNILGAHIDSPRLDLKQNPLYESNGFALLDTHYYGGIKNYQWVTLPLAMHGVIAKKDGTVVDINVGDDEGDPVFCVSDLLIHLASQQMDKKGNKMIEGEDLDILIGNRPLSIDGEDADGEGADEGGEGAKNKGAAKEPVKAFALKLLADKYGIEEADFLSAEIEMVPAGRARELGFDRSMVIGYGQDDRVCAYTSLIAQLEAPADLAKTAVTVLVDKEKIGSVGATGMASNFFRTPSPRLWSSPAKAACSRYDVRFPHRACSPPTCRPASIPSTRASSSRRTPHFSGAGSCSTSTRAHAGRAAATMRVRNTWRACVA